MPDERVSAAIAHWAPRFVTNGVDMNDFQTVTASVERWEEWLPAWVANGNMHAGLAREAEEQGRSRTAGEAWNRAALSYHFGKFVWMVDMDRYREATLLAVEALRNAHRHLDPGAERVEIPYAGTVDGLEPPPPGGQRAPAARPAPARPRLDEGGVLRLGERLPRARPRDALARRPRPGRDRALRRASSPPTRRRSPRRSTTSPGATTSTSTASGSRASRSAATTHRARPPTSGASRRRSGSAARSTSRSAGTRCRVRPARPSPTTSAPPTRSRPARRRPS